MEETVALEILETLIFTNDAPCVENQYELNIDGDNVNGTAANYKARISVYWSPSGGIDPGSISGDQVVCANGDPLAFASCEMMVNPQISQPTSLTNGKKMLVAVVLGQILAVQPVQPLTHLLELRKPHVIEE